MKPSVKIETRTATEHDVPQLIEVWRTVFEDTETYIRFFLQERCVFEKTLVLIADGRIVSQLFLLPTHLRIGSTLLSVDYLFAAATLPQYRGRGYMSRLLRYAQDTNETDGIILLPGEDSLYEYYACFGFRSVFSRNVWSGSRTFLLPYAESSVCDAASAEEFLAQDQQTRDGVVWSDEAIRYALLEQSRYRGAYTVADGCAFAAVGEECTILSDAQHFGKGVYALLSMTDDAFLTLILPSDAPIGIRQKGGMLWSRQDSMHIQDAFLSFPME